MKWFPLVLLQAKVVGTSRQDKHNKEFPLEFPLVLLQAKVVGLMIVNGSLVCISLFPLVLLQAKVVGNPFEGGENDAVVVRFPLVLLQAKVVGHAPWMAICGGTMFPLVLLQAKVVGSFSCICNVLLVVSISSPSSEGGGNCSKS